MRDMEARLVNSKNHEGFTPQEIEKHKQSMKENEEILAKYGPIVAEIEAELKKRGELKEDGEGEPKTETKQGDSGNGGEDSK